MQSNNARSVNTDKRSSRVTNRTLVYVVDCQFHVSIFRWIFTIVTFCEWFAFDSKTTNTLLLCLDFYVISFSKSTWTSKMKNVLPDLQPQGGGGGGGRCKCEQISTNKCDLCERNGPKLKMLIGRAKRECSCLLLSDFLNCFSSFFHLPKYIRNRRWWQYHRWEEILINTIWPSRADHTGCSTLTVTK